MGPAETEGKSVTRVWGLTKAGREVGVFLAAFSRIQEQGFPHIRVSPRVQVPLRSPCKSSAVRWEEFWSVRGPYFSSQLPAGGWKDQAYVQWPLWASVHLSGEREGGGCHVFLAPMAG